MTRVLTTDEQAEAMQAEQAERQQVALAEAAGVDPDDLDAAQEAVADALEQLEADEDADLELIKAVQQFSQSLRADVFPNNAANFAIVAAWRTGWSAAEPDPPEVV